MAVVDVLARCATIINPTAGDEIVLGPEKDEILLVVSGAVRAEWRVGQARRRALFRMLPAGALVARSRATSIGFRAHVASTVALLTRTAFESLVESSLIGFFFHDAFEMDWSLPSTDSPSERVVAVFKRLVEDFGRREEDGVVIDLPLTATDIGNLARASRTVVQRQISDFKNQGVLLSSGGRWKVSTSFVYRAGPPPFARDNDLTDEGSEGDSANSHLPSRPLRR